MKKVIIIEIKLQKLSGINKKEHPEDLKLNWIAYDKVVPSEMVRIDNHHNKGLHYHVNGKEVFFAWINLEKTWELFYQKIVEKFGAFVKKD